MTLNKMAIGLTIARAFQMTLLFLSIKLITLYLNEEQLGYYYSIGAFVSFFNLVFLSAPATYLTRHLYALNNNKKLLNSFFYLGVWILLISFFSAFFLYFLNIYELFTIENIKIYIVLCLIFSTFYRNVLNGFNTLLKPKLFIIFSSISVILGIVISFVLVFYFKTALSWLTGTLIAEFIVFILAMKYFFVGKQEFERINTDKLKEVFTFSYPLAFSSLFLWIQTQAFKIITEFRYSAEALSSIALGISISSGIFAGIEVVLGQIYNPKFYIDINSNKLGRETAWKKLQEATLPLYILTFFFIITFTEDIINLLVSGNFNNLRLFIQIGAAINFIRILVNNLQLITISERTTLKLIIPSIISCFVLLCLLFFIDFNSRLYLIPASILLSFFLSLFFLYRSLAKIFVIRINLLTVLIPSVPLFLFLIINALFSIMNFWIFSFFSIYYTFIFIRTINYK